MRANARPVLVVNSKVPHMLNLLQQLEFAGYQAYLRIKGETSDPFLNSCLALVIEETILLNSDLALQLILDKKLVVVFSDQHSTETLVRGMKRLGTDMSGHWKFIGVEGGCQTERIMAAIQEARATPR